VRRNAALLLLSTKGKMGSSFRWNDAMRLNAWEPVSRSSPGWRRI